MPYFTVNAIVSYIGWVRVEADSASEALSEASECPARDFEVDPSTGHVAFDVEPTVEAE